MGIPDLLRSCPVFFDLYEDEVEKIVRTCPVRIWDQGNLIREEGSADENIYVLLTGQAEVCKTAPGGRILVQELVSGDLFGLVSILGEKTCQADVVAAGPCQVLEISHETIFRLYKKESAVFGLMMLNISRLLSRRIVAANDVIARLRHTPRLRAIKDPEAA